MNTDYIVIKQPVITKSIFIDALAFDIRFIIPHMHAKIPHRANHLQNMDTGS